MEISAALWVHESRKELYFLCVILHMNMYTYLLHMYMYTGSYLAWTQWYSLPYDKHAYNRSGDS